MSTNEDLCLLTEIYETSTVDSINSQLAMIFI